MLPNSVLAEARKHLVFSFMGPGQGLAPHLEMVNFGMGTHRLLLYLNVKMCGATDEAVSPQSGRWPVSFHARKLLSLTLPGVVTICTVTG